MARIYATEADYQTFTGDLSATSSPALLRAASARIETALRGVLWDTDDETGLPADDDVAEAFKDAVCALVQYWDEIGDTTGSGATSQFQSATIGSASYTRAAGTAAPYKLPQTVVDILSAAELLSVDPIIYG